MSTVKAPQWWAHKTQIAATLELNFCTFYLFELKLCRMVELCIEKKILRFLFFDFNGFWWENDVTRLTEKLKFQDMA